ncbi:MAG: UDP-N-acetylglucosamine 2-epimerase (non-hydrolyzing) [Saprospiraceae bacterium]|nr:UDP-N-acetylglucosamine 2-epimerase (non-hydrolyzing) [Saprospiraceae bacterium]
MIDSKIFHIITVVGARPQFIKAAALSRAFSKNTRIKETIVHSGQHYDYNLSEGFFRELDLPKPKYNLEIGSQAHNKMIGQFLIAFDDIITKENPDLIVVFGDTNTTSAAAIGAAKRNIPLAHVEAGLREWDKSIPEEVNKLITDSISDLYFSPTQTGVDNLKAVGVTQNVFKTGDISLDLLFHHTQYLDENLLRFKYNLNDAYVFMTCHRDSNTADPQKLSSILQGVAQCGLPVVFAMHPRTKSAIEKFELGHFITPNIQVIEPLGFWETQSLLKYATIAITDSGGIIKEAYFHKVPGIIIDTQTEWIETLDEGWNHIAGPDKDKIIELVQKNKKPSIHTNALGDGNCGDRITKEIETFLDQL